MDAKKRLDKRKGGGFGETAYQGTSDRLLRSGKICFQPDLSGVRKSVAEYAGRLFQGGPNPSRSSFICFMSGKRKGLSTRRWRKRAISSICVHYASAWCATTASLFARRLTSAAGVQSGCRKQENRFRLWTGAPHEDHCGEKIG